MIRGNARKFGIGISAAAGLAMAAIALAGQLTAQAQVPPGDAPPAEPAERASAVKVGTYDPDKAFEAHPAQAELMDALRTAQSQMQQGERGEEAQVQEQYQQARQQAIQRFQEDVSKAIPQIAQAAGVKVVAVQVVYKAADVKTVDITPHLVRTFAEDKEAKQPSRAPQFPR